MRIKMSNKLTRTISADWTCFCLQHYMEFSFDFNKARPPVERKLGTSLMEWTDHELVNLVEDQLSSPSLALFVNFPQLHSIRLFFCYFSKIMQKFPIIDHHEMISLFNSLWRKYCALCDIWNQLFSITLMPIKKATTFCGIFRHRKYLAS